MEDIVFPFLPCLVVIHREILLKNTKQTLNIFGVVGTHGHQLGKGVLVMHFF